MRLFPLYYITEERVLYTAFTNLIALCLLYKDEDLAHQYLRGCGGQRISLVQNHTRDSTFGAVFVLRKSHTLSAEVRMRDHFGRAY